ncbi:PIG-L family deacetylase [Microbacterium marinum]|uniref:PIG-L family deacetylase n=1 Tax=Microbacterium marinum TaxID=421115 RepID=UPI00384F2244
MSVAFDHRDPGTPETSWRSVDIDAEPLSLTQSRLVVVAAHPDDETLGAGGLLATAAAAGLDITVIVATDGEAADPEQRGAGLERRRELTAALYRLAPRARVRHLALPDGGLRENTRRLISLLTAELAAFDPDDTLIAVTWWGDGHRDHRVLGETVRSIAHGARVIGIPIWYWHWGDPASPDPGPWQRLALTPRAIAAKSAAIAEHSSQQGGDRDDPILHGSMLAHFQRDHELFIDAGSAAPEPSVDPARFEEYFRTHDDPWGFDSRWYEQRKRALLTATLPRRHFSRTLELGCSTGALTAELAARSDEIVAVDASPTAVARARDRVPEAIVEERVLPEDWPEGTWDLVVLSELGYYWSHDDLTTAVRRIVERLREDGVVIACHWRRTIPDAVLDAAAVHRAIGRSGLQRLARHVEEDFILEAWTPYGVPSVAAAEGLA